MPYNLRKRTRPEPVQAEVEVKKRRVAVKKPRAPIVKSSKKEVLATKETHEETITKPVPNDTKVPVAKSKIKPAVVEHDSKPSVLETKSKPSVIEPKPSDTSPNVMAFGADSCGELGLGKIGISRKSPTLVPIGNPVKKVACGPMHILTLTEDGQVYSNGCNDEGALGRITDGDETLEATPTLVPIKNKVIKITAGDSHSAVLTDKQEVFIWGNFRDEHGSVGLTPSSEGKPVYQPTQILPDTKLMDIASGSNHMLLLDVEGNVYSFGVGAQGQLGRLKLEEIEKDGKSNSITADNRELFLSPHRVGLKDVDPQRAFICDAIYAGNCSSFATNTDKKKNRLAGWGSNNYFQLGYKGQKGVVLQPFPRRSTFTCSTSMINVACGQHHTLFLTKTGRVHAAGRQDYGMLGLGEGDKEICPAKPLDAHLMGDAPIIDISAGINVSFAVNELGKLYSWGMGGTNLGLKDDKDLIQPTEVTSLKGMKVLSVSAGGSFTSVVTN